MSKSAKKSPTGGGNGAALLKLAAVLLIGVAAGALMFRITLRSTPDSLLATSAGTVIADLQGLTDQHSVTFDVAPLQGQYSIVYFGFTFCPDACPTALYNLTLALAQLDADATRIQPVFVSVDPARDSPAKIGEYLSHFSTRFIGLTGTPEVVQLVQQRFGVIAVEHRDATLPGGYTMDHSNEFLLFSPMGKLLRRLPADQGVEVLVEQLRGLTRAEAV